MHAKKKAQTLNISQLKQLSCGKTLIGACYIGGILTKSKVMDTGRKLVIIGMMFEGEVGIQVETSH